MVTLTVFTPSYNRADLLPRLYRSLQRQTSKDFLWLIIDDGSTDSTETLVKQWTENEKDFTIEYVFKENGGLHTAYNEAIARLQTELAVCIDSDDYMPDDAVETIVSFWQENGSEEYGGIVALDSKENGEIIGDLLPDRKAINLIGLLTNAYHIRNGDRKNVFRSELYKKVAPMPSFGNEKNFNPHYMHLQISKEYDLLVLNKSLCVVEYQDGGMTNNMIKQYYTSPNSFAQIRRLYLSFENTPFSFRFKTAVHYVSSCLLARQKHILKNSPRKIPVILAFPFGMALSILIRFKYKKMYA